MKNIVENQGIKNDKPVPLSYEQLKQRLDAVVAECAGLREQSEEVYAAGYNHGHLNTVDGIAYAPGTKDEFYSLALRVMAEVETPSVTAALAEVEAKAIDKAIERITSVMKHPEVSQVVSTLGMFVDVLEAFKKELREGRG
ncbi:hypothetical protein ACUNEV_00575 [Serratia sp. IR-2025]